jgi:uncharacterized protein YjiS (DUF1127 family)
LLRDIGACKAEMEREASRLYKVRTRKAQTQSSRPLQFLRACLAAAEWLAHEQLRHAAREIDPRMLDDLAISDPETARALRKLFDL